MGACEECDGIGVKLNVDPNLVVPNEKKTIADGAIIPWAKSSTLYYAYYGWRSTSRVKMQTRQWAHSFRSRSNYQSH